MRLFDGDTVLFGILTHRVIALHLHVCKTRSLSPLFAHTMKIDVSERLSNCVDTCCSVRFLKLLTLPNNMFVFVVLFVLQCQNTHLTLSDFAQHKLDCTFIQYMNYPLQNYSDNKLMNDKEIHHCNVFVVFV